MVGTDGLRTASVVIDNYNYERYVSGAIDSALAQTWPHVEVIVVDDGSTDGSGDIIRSYGERIRPVFKSNGGMGSALNAGIAAASGSVVFLLDADDELDPRAVEVVLGGWRSDTVMVHHPLAVVDGSGSVMGLLPADPSALADGDVRDDVLCSGSFPTVVTSGLAFRADALARVMPIPADVFRQAADGYLVRAIAFEGPVQRCDSVLGRYRRHGSNDSLLGAEPAGLAAAYRKKLQYLTNEYEAVRSLAHRHGLECSPDLGEDDPAHLLYRLASLRLDPAAHPRPDDRRIDLFRRVAVCRWRAGGSAPRRVAEIAVAASCLTPRPVAARALAWWESPRRRPAWLRRRPRS